MMEMKKREWLIGWVILNLIWWVASIGLGYTLDIDLNPLLNNNGETILNIVIFICGLLIIRYTEIGESEYND